jgi:hypothetical protein
VTSRLRVQCRRRATGRQLPRPRLRAVLVPGAACVLAVVCISGCSRGSVNRLSSGSAAGHAAAGTVPLTVLTGDTNGANGANGANGDIFIAPAGGGYPAGPEIVTTAGKVVWFHRLPAGDVATDFRTQMYLGQRPAGYCSSGTAPPTSPTPTATSRCRPPRALPGTGFTSAPSTSTPTATCW